MNKIYEKVSKALSGLLAFFEDGDNKIWRTKKLLWVVIM